MVLCDPAPPRDTQRTQDYSQSLRERPVYRFAWLREK